MTAFEPDPYTTLTIGGEDVDTDAWFCLNKDEVLDAFAPQRRDNVPLDGVDGRLARPTFDDEQTIDLRWLMTGEVAPDGTPYANPAAGQAANKRLFVATYFRATRDANGQVACTGIDIDGTEVAGGIQVDAPKFGEGLFDRPIVMSVTLAAGELKVT